ncbi:hypothetical protein LMIY3S_04629 [Labrys miyagiensis]
MTASAGAAGKRLGGRSRALLVLGLLFVGLALFGSSGHAAEESLGLPLEIHRSSRPDGTIMLLLSGDNGWGDLEEAVAKRANEAGISVIGINSYRYFFSGSTPVSLAADLQRILAFYGRSWHGERFVLAGYSFGADALPFVWKHLPEETRRRTALIALIGLQPAANFSISIWEMLNFPAPDDVPIEPAVRQLPRHKVLCIHGARDGEACNLPVLDGAARVSRPGGHGFDGDYGAVAEAILARLHKVR